MAYQEICVECFGRGRNLGRMCKSCRGKGVVPVDPIGERRRTWIPGGASKGWRRWIMSQGTWEI
jgi:DnaJ-class molecular chaperone